MRHYECFVLLFITRTFVELFFSSFVSNVSLDLSSFLLSLSLSKSTLSQRQSRHTARWPHYLLKAGSRLADSTPWLGTVLSLPVYTLFSPRPASPTIRVCRLEFERTVALPGPVNRWCYLPEKHDVFVLCAAQKTPIERSSRGFRGAKALPESTKIS